MKKLCLLLSLLLVLSLAACGESAPAQDPAAVYLQTAQQYIDSGDTTSAIAVLEEGITVTGSEELSKMLEQLKTPAEEQTSETEQAEETTDAPQERTCGSCNARLAENAKFCPECGASAVDSAPLTTCPQCDAELAEGAKFCTECGANITAQSSQAPDLDPSNPYADYAGIWVYADTPELSSSYKMVISAPAGSIDLHIRITETETDPASEIEVSIPLDRFTSNNEATVSFADKSGNSGDLRLLLDGTTVVVYFENVSADFPSCLFFYSQHESEAALQAALNDSNLLSSMDPTQRQDLNEFLSCFAETWMGTYNTTIPTDAMVNFAFIHNKNHNYENMLDLYEGAPYEYGSYAFPAATIAATIQEFFGVSHTHPSGDYHYSDSLCYTADGYYHTSPASGAYTGYVVVAEDMYMNQGGLYDVKFTVYEIDSSYYYEHGENRAEFCAMTAEEAAQDSNLTIFRTGEAMLNYITAADGSAEFYLQTYSTAIP